MHGARSASGSGPSRKPGSRARRLSVLAGAVAVFLVVTSSMGRSSSTHNGQAFSEGATASPSPNFAAITGGGDGTASGLGTNPSVAVYFTGQGRTLRRTLCSIRSHIFTPLIDQGFTPVVFVAGEEDADAGDYKLLLGAIPDVELGAIVVVPRPVPRDDAKSNVNIDILPDPTDDPLLPPIPKKCIAEFQEKARWFHNGGDATDQTTRNSEYTNEVVAQIWYRGVVDRLRRQWEATERGKLAGEFAWIVDPRPDSIYVNDLPDLAELSKKLDDTIDDDLITQDNASDSDKDAKWIQGTVFIPSWGTGYDPTAGNKWKHWGPFVYPSLFPKKKRQHESKKNRVGENNRFAVGGLAAMSIYHELYTQMCHGGLVTSLPPNVNFEQMVRFYFDHPETKAKGLRRSIPLPDHFWFFRLRKGAFNQLTQPVEHPGHEPSMVGDEWHPAGLRRADSIVPLIRKHDKEVVEAERWRLWRLASKEAWRCDDLRLSGAGVNEKKGECLLNAARSEWGKTEWLRKLVPIGGVRKMVFPGGWLEGKISRKCSKV